MGYEPYRIDLLVDVTGLIFENCYKRKVEIELDKTKINFLHLDDLIVAKKKTGRLQDLADVEQFDKIKKKENT